MSLFDLIPGYREAVKRESDIRDEAFLGLTVDICGLSCVPMSARHFVALDLIGSPLLAAEPLAYATPADVAVFLWLLSPGYSPHARIRRWRFIRRCRPLPFVQAVCEIQAFIRDTFQDAPPADTCPDAGPAYYSHAVNFVHTFASAYGWSEEAILTMPLRRAFQYMRRLTKQANPKATLFNTSDRVRGDWLASLSRKN